MNQTLAGDVDDGRYLNDKEKKKELKDIIC